MRCPACDAILPMGANCDLEDSDWFIWTPNTDGTVDDPHTLEPVLSADVDQLLTCGATGLIAVMPTSLSDPPSVQAYNSTDLPIANATLTTVTLNVELYDTDTMHSISANTERVTFTTAGNYAVNFVCAWNKNVTGARMAQIRKNGTDILAYESKDSGGADLIVGHCIGFDDDFAATNYIEARVHQTSGVALRLLSETYSPVLTVTRIA